MFYMLDLVPLALYLSLYDFYLSQTTGKYSMSIPVSCVQVTDLYIYKSITL